MEQIEVEDHLQNEPKAPEQFKMLYEDTTREAFFTGLNNSFSSAGLVSAEGGGLIRSGMFNDIAKLNSLWSGEKVTIDTKTAGSFGLEGVRATVSVMVQPDVLTSYLEVKGELSRASGLWARSLIFEPVSLQGCRVIKKCSSGTEKVDAFSNRLSELLEESLSLKKTGFKRKVIKFSADAGDLLCDFAQSIENLIRPGSTYELAGDHASKLPENVSRVAALIHNFEGFSGDISVATTEDAIAICMESSEFFMERFVPPPQVDLDAHSLNEMLNDRYRYPGVGRCSVRYIHKNHVRQRCPNKLRGGGRFDIALDRLCQQGVTMLYQEVKPNGMLGRYFIDLFPRDPPDSAVGICLRPAFF